MELHEYAALDAVALAELVRSGALAPGEPTAAALAGAERVDAAVHAIVELYADAGERGAAAAVDGPLAGVPTLRKDLGFTEAGRGAELGSALAAGQVAPTTSRYWERLRGAGVVAVGRSRTSELGVAITVEPPDGPAVVNPWDATLSAGGSSGGAAALVAAGVVPFAHANDAGGSIRIPAALCGAVGLKPSRGRVTAAPDGAHHVFGMVSELGIARSVRDLATVLDVVSPPAPGDAFAIRQPATSYAEAARRGAPGRLRVALDTGPWLGGPVDAEAAATAELAARTLEAAGHEVAPFALALDERLYLDTVLLAFSLTAAAGVDGLAAATGRDPAAAHPVTRLWADHGRALGPDAHDAVWDGVNRLSRSVGEQLAPFDLLLTPTLAQPALPLGTLAGERFASASEHNLSAETATQFATLFNVTGQPAITLPLGSSARGLPLGVQLVGPPGGDELVIAAASALEAALPWRDRRPPVHVAGPTVPRRP